jgi:hypothetical protein
MSELKVLSEPQMEAMGITRRAVRQAGFRLLRQGRLRGLTKKEIAAEILDEIASENPTAFSDVAGVDWDSILAFIEKLLPIILQIIAMF